MGIDFSKVTPPASSAGSAPAASTEIETVQPYDIVADRQQMNETLTNSEEYFSRQELTSMVRRSSSKQKKQESHQRNS